MKTNFISTDQIKGQINELRVITDKEKQEQLFFESAHDISFSGNSRNK